MILRPQLAERRVLAVSQDAAPEVASFLLERGHELLQRIAPLGDRAFRAPVTGVDQSYRLG